MIRMLGCIAAVVLVACGGKTGNYKVDYAGPIQIELQNQTSRPIEQIFIFPRGAANRGTSWATIAPGASTTVKLKEGMFELVARSAKRRIDERWVETPESSTLLELREDLASTPRKLVFHDDGTEPAGIDQRGTLGIKFMLTGTKPADEGKTDEPTTEAVPGPAEPAPTSP